MVIFQPFILWLPSDRGSPEAKCIWATGVLLWQPGMDLVCVGGGRFKGPQAGYLYRCEYASLSRNSPCLIHLLNHGIQANPE